MTPAPHPLPAGRDVPPGLRRGAGVLRMAAVWEMAAERPCGVPKGNSGLLTGRPCELLGSYPDGRCWHHSADPEAQRRRERHAQQTHGRVRRQQNAMKARAGDPVQFLAGRDVDVWAYVGLVAGEVARQLGTPRKRVERVAALIEALL